MTETAAPKAFPQKLARLADEQRHRLLEFFEPAHSEWAAGGEALNGYRQQFARYLEELDPEGRKGAFALTFKYIHERKYGIVEWRHEQPDNPGGRVRMPSLVEQGLYALSAMAPLEWDFEELDWMLSHVPYSQYIFPSWRQAFHEPVMSLDSSERRSIPAATRRMEAILLLDFRDGPGLHPEVRKFNELLLDDDPGTGRIPLQYVTDDDDFGPRVGETLQAVFPGYQSARLLLFMSELTGPKPTAKWKRAAAKYVAEQPVALMAAQRLLGITAERNPTSDFGEFSCLTPYSGSVVRASLWLLAFQPDAPEQISLIRDASAYLGAGHNGKNGVCRSTTGANAGVEALLEIARSHPDATTEVVGALARIRDVVKNKNLHKRLVSVIDQLSSERGIAPSELLETAVPDLGFDAQGVREFAAGSYTARVALTNSTGAAAVELVWVDVDARRVAMPSEFKNTPLLAEVKLAVSEAKRSLGSQRRRLEGLMASDRSWTGADFRTRYLEHPVVGTIARQLLWTLASNEGGFSGYPRRIEGDAGWELAGIDGEVREITSDAVVVLWKPWERGAEEVRAWRLHQMKQQIRQPFRQVYRELYLLTDAERQTKLYSNRFAAHILDYPRAQALLKDRGWHGTQLGSWDGGQDSQLYVEFLDERLRAGFSIELLEVHDDLASLCTTNRVWFERNVARDTWEPVDLGEVPRAVFSEAMRDVDLVTAVAAIGPDLEWADHPNSSVQIYWSASHTAPLTESAQTRREYLANILPRTILAENCELTDRHLLVRGTLRSYKIHLGSGNILMEPDDSYLCIVQAPGSRAERIFLPFEEKAGRLATILSKAFMLSNDHKIKDPSTLSQIQGSR
ncbi:DUF4132 domain-containing protein [Paenarthrobacter nicotinovorans]|uniref:DUF4132 domain-containing protein n=1 Tax=Paenarthrobacter nicotinovorans TaxID=29320 RepID=UPI0016425E69|nr:DUF4132 domain-containing protein [Paenarthrobacter nicotinovorans]